MEKGGEIADLLSFSPTEFDLPAGETEKVILTLKVPEDAKLGDHSGWIKAAGKKPVSGASGEGSVIGYTISLKTKTHANFVNACTEIAQSEPIGITIGMSSPSLPSFDATTAIIVMIIIATFLGIRKKSGGGRT